MPGPFPAGKSVIPVKKLSIVLAVIGLLLATLLVGFYGLEKVAATVGSIGWSGFGILLLCQLCLFPVLGLAWYVIVPKQASAPGSVFLWGRMMRDAAANCLPFSPIGGFVLGARAVT